MSDPTAANTKRNSASSASSAGIPVARPGLRERRLSRVHFDSDDDGSRVRMPMDTPLPLNIRQGAAPPEAEVDSARQEYFDAPVANDDGEENRGQRVTSTGFVLPRPTPALGLLPSAASVAANAGRLDDISPRSTVFDDGQQASAAPAAAPPPVRAQPAQQGPQLSTVQWQPQPFPRGPPAAHIRGSPQLPSEPFHVPSSVYHTPRMGNGAFQEDRRSSAPSALDHGARARAATCSKGARYSIDSGRYSISGPSMDAYANLPPSVRDRGLAPSAAHPPGPPNMSAFYQSPQQQQPLPHDAFRFPQGQGQGLRQDHSMYVVGPEYGHWAPSPAAGQLPPYQSSPHRPSQSQPGLKPALRRTQTEEEARRATRDAVDIVHAHTQGLRQRKGGADEDGGRSAAEKSRNAGVLSNLLQLYGTSTVPRRSNSTGAESEALSRSTSVESKVQPRMNRMDSNVSMATTLYEEDLDPHDPRLRQNSGGDSEKQRPNLPGARDGRFSYNQGGDASSIRSKRSFKDLIRRRRSFALDEDAVYADMVGKPNMVPVNSKTRKRRLSITKHVADILQRHNFILKLAKALMTFGSPSHRLESQLAATAQVLEVDAQFIHLPSVVIASFGDPDTHTSETHFVKAAGGLDLGRLQAVHNLYRQVVHDEISVQEGSAGLSKLLKADPIYKVWQRVLLASCAAGVIAPLGFGGSFVDAWVSASFGALLAFLQLHVVRKSAMYANIFEISVATLTSFIARGLSTTQYFCYPALASSGVVLILPGYVILCGSLELASKNLVAGSVRMVYAIIYSLFIGFGIAIGSDFWFLIDPTARKSDASLDGNSAFSISGTFNAMNGTSPFMLEGAFTFNNQTLDQAHQELFKGNVGCVRDPSWEWWRQGVSPYTFFALVPIFSLLICLSNLTPIRSKQLPVMVAIACTGFVTNMVANRYIFNHSDVVSFLGSFVVGILGNLYSRIFRGTGFVVMVPGILFLVPSGIAAAGGLAMTESGANGDSYSNGLVIGFRMIQVAIGITVGLFFSSFIVYSFGRRKQAALFAF